MQAFITGGSSRGSTTSSKRAWRGTELSAARRFFRRTGRSASGYSRDKNRTLYLFS